MSDTPKPLDRFLQDDAPPTPPTPEQLAIAATIQDIANVFDAVKALMLNNAARTAELGWQAIYAVASDEDKLTLQAVPGIRALWPNFSSGELPPSYDTPQTPPADDSTPST